MYSKPRFGFRAIQGTKNTTLIFADDLRTGGLICHVDPQKNRGAADTYTHKYKHTYTRIHDDICTHKKSPSEPTPSAVSENVHLRLINGNV
jgi:hypothetical protein